MATTAIPVPSTSAALGNVSLRFVIAVSFIVMVLFAWVARWRGLILVVSPSNILNLLSPLVFAAAFIERAVEIVISPWRDPGAATLASQVEMLKAQNPPDPEKIAHAQQNCRDYTAKTQQYAFAASICFSLASAYVGVRALWPFVDHASFERLGANQQWSFLVLDVALSAALLAGGADGIHSAVNAFTTFFDATAQKAQQSVKQ